MSRSHLGLILWFLYKENFLWWTLETLKDPFGFLPRGAFMPVKKPRIKFQLRLSEVDWWKLIWFCTTIPRHASSLGLLRKTNYILGIKVYSGSTR